MRKIVNYKKELEKIKIIDVHMHLGLHSRIHYMDYSDEKVIKIGRKFGVEKCLCSHIMGFTNLNEQIKMINELSKKYGNYINWYLVYDPNNPSKSLKLIKENMKKINFIGVKIHPPRHECRLNDEKYYPLWDFAIKNNIVILSHTWSPYTSNPKQFYGNPLLIEDVLKKFKDLKFIVGHSGGKIPFYDEVISLLERNSNLYMDCSGDTLYPELFRKVIHKLGSERMMFGTDMPLIDTRYHIINILNAGLTRNELDNILYKNDAKLFKLK